MIISKIVKSSNFPVKKKSVSTGCPHPLDQVTRLKLNDGRKRQIGITEFAGGNNVKDNIQQLFCS